MSRTSKEKKALSDLQRAAVALKQMRAKIDALESSRNEPIAVVGMSCRIPGSVDSPQAYWELLANGVDAITEVPADRWDVNAYYDSNPDTPGKMHSRCGGFLDGIDQFDADFFGIFPREAMGLDPQHRLLLEVSWEALEHAGLSFDRRVGNPVGVFLGITANDYAQLLIRAGDPSLLDAYFMTGNPLNFAAGRLSYTLGLQGPCMVLDTACSSSLVAVHQACNSLRAEECDVALAGGVNVILCPENTAALSRTRLMAPDGRCKTFDASADGYVRSEGCGIVVLKRLSHAQSNGDHILAVIRGSAVNQDGPSSGLTVPNGLAQQRLIRRALTSAGIDADALDYVEAHGTGTALGDPIEVKAVGEVLGKSRSAEEPLMIGSVKSNIGHLESAAGVAGLIKVILALQHETIPPHLHFKTPNPQIPWDELPIKVPTERTAWPADTKPRTAGISSFGASGINAHVILSEAPKTMESDPSRRWQLIMLSAKNEGALEQSTANLARFLRQHPENNLSDVAYTLQVGRQAFSGRRMVMCKTGPEAAEALETLDPKQVLTHWNATPDRSIGFMFPGIGDHYVNMGRQLYAREEGFRKRIDQCCERIQPELEADLQEVIYPEGESADDPLGSDSDTRPAIDLRKMLSSERGETDAGRKINQVRFAHPAVFAVEYALAKLWMDWGLQPQVMIGYSIGEYVAACLSGVIRLEDALRLVARRAQMIASLPAGAMLAVPLTEDEIRPLVAETLSLAAVNGPAMCVVSGPLDAVKNLEEKLTARQIACRRIASSHAFHSQMMAPIQAAFLQLLSTMPLHPPKIPYVSNLTGTWITAEQATDPEYWWRHTCSAVRFADGVDRLLETPGRVLLEVGPGQSLGSFVLQHPSWADASQCAVLPSLPHRNALQADDAFILSTLGRLWLEGVNIAWDGFYAREKRHRTPLPTYPFQRQRHWFLSKDGTRIAPKRPLSGEKAPLADWFCIPSWQRKPAIGCKTHLQEQRACWLVLLDECGVGQEMASQLRSFDQTVVTIGKGKRFKQLEETSYTIKPGRREDYDALIQALRQGNLLPDKIVHLWTVTPDAELPVGRQPVEEIQESGFYSLLYLAQAIGDQEIDHRVQLGVISNQMQGVTGGDMAFPEKATLLGPCKVIPQEYATIRCCSIDIEAPASSDKSCQTLAAQIIGELAADLPDEVVSFRGNYRWVQTYESLPLERSGELPVPFRKGGVYLITGGLGGLGLEIAHHLSKSVNANLVLIGRSGLPHREEWDAWITSHDETDVVSDRIKSVRALEASGAQVLILKADVSDRDAMRSAVRQTLERFQSIHGVVHAAGVPGAGLVQLKTKPMVEAVFAPKIQGTLVLEEVLEDLKLDFLALFSSNLAISGGYGQVDYCAANAFLDAYACHRAIQKGIRTVSISWDMWQVDKWQGALMKALPQLQDQLHAKRSKFGMTSEEGWQAFSHIVAGVEPLVVVSTRDFQIVQAEHTADSASHMLKTLKEDRDSHPKQARPRLRTTHVAPTNEVEERIAELWQELFGIEQIGIHDNFLELGGHSILGVQLISRMRRIYQLDLPLRTIFEAPTVAELALVVEEQLMAEIENLPGEEVARLMASDQAS